MFVLIKQINKQAIYFNNLLVLLSIYLYMMQKLITFLCCVFFVNIVIAQKTKAQLKEERKQRINAMVKHEEEGVITYRKQNALGVKLTNDGFGVSYEFGRAQSIKRMLLFQFELATRLHPREQKETNLAIGGAPFVYGKINHFYMFKTGVQQQFLFGNKSNKNGVSVTGNVGVGVSVGLLRPYYVEVNDDVNRVRKDIKYESADSLTFQSTNKLNELRVTGSKFSKGWDEIKINPGGYAKAGLRFDYGRYNETVSAIEVGLSAEFYSKKVPQLVFIDPKQLFFNAYVTILFGKRK